MQNKSETQIQSRRVLVVNQANWEGISRLPYLFSRANFLVDVISPRKNFIAQSSFIDCHYPVPDHVESIVDFLEKHLSSSRKTYERVIIGDDPLLYALCKIFEKPWVKAILPCDPAPENVEFISSKIAFIIQAHRHGIRVPDFEICVNADQLNAAVTRLGFPLVLKKSEGFGGSSVFFIKNQGELDYLKIEEPVVAQKFIDGKTVSAAALYERGALSAYYSYYRHRTSKAFGVSTAVKFKVFPELESMLRSLGSISGFNGISGVDLIEHSQTGKLYLLEKNFRPTLTVLIGKHVGVDLVDILKRTANTSESHAPVKQIDRPGKVVPLFPGDLLRAIDKLDYLGWARWLVSPSYVREICWYDWKLLVFNVKYVANFAFWNLGRKCKGVVVNTLARMKVEMP